ncbi:hypothetical protein [Sulfurisphaera ohwakuensis]
METYLKLKENESVKL